MTCKVIAGKTPNNRMHSGSKKRRSSFLIALLFASGDPDVRSRNLGGRTMSTLLIAIGIIVCVFIALALFTNIGADYTKKTDQQLLMAQELSIAMQGQPDHGH